MFSVLRFGCIFKNGSWTEVQGNISYLRVGSILDDGNDQSGGKVIFRRLWGPNMLRDARGGESV